MIIGLDIGTSSLKYSLIEIRKGNLKVLYEGKKNYETNIYNNQQLGTINPDVIVKETRQTLERLLGKYKNKIEAIGLDSMAPIFIGLDKNRKPLISVMYNSLLGSEYLRKLDKREIIAHTNNIPNIQMYIHKILWIRKNRPNLLKSIRLLIDLNGYILKELTNDEVQDYFTALEWGLVDIKTKKWWKIVDDLEIRDKLPELVEPYYHSFYNKIPLFIGTVDVIAGALGSIGLEDDALYASLGSTLCAGLVVQKPVISENLYLDYYFNDKFLLNGCNSQFSTVLDWFYSVFGKIPANIQIRKKPSLPIFLPYLMGERSPIFNPNAKAILFGITRSTNRYDIINSILWSLVYMFIDVTEYLQNYKKTPIRKVIIDGGLKRNKALIRMISSCLGRGIYITRFNSPSVGAAIIALNQPNFKISNEEFSFEYSIDKNKDKECKKLLYIYRKLYFINKKLFNIKL